MAEKIKVPVKLSELPSISQQLNGVYDNKYGAKIKNGLLDEEITFKAKYWLDKIADLILKEIEALSKTEKKIFESYDAIWEGTNLYVPAKIKVEDKEEDNPRYKDFLAEYNSLLDQEIEIECVLVPASLLGDLKSGNNYKSLNRFIDIEK